MDMVKQSVTISLDEKILATLREDRGGVPLSTFIDSFMEIIYSDKNQISENVHICRVVMGFRNTPEAVEYLLKEALAAKEEELELLRKNHPILGVIGPRS